MNNFKTYIKGLGVCMLLLLTGPISFAQSEGSTIALLNTTEMMIILVLFVMLLVLLVAFYLLTILQVMVREDGIRKAKEKGLAYIEEPSAWSKFYDSLTGAVPIEKENTIVLDHDYDGIKELDNHLPPWWTYMFYACIVFAVIYMFLYHVSGTLPLQTQEYEIAMAEAQANKASAEADGNAVDESNIVFSEDPAVISSGKTVYNRNCVACHKAAGEGGIGPNLTDDYWLHGGSIQEIYNTIKNGVPDKGMIAWGEVLSPAKMNDVTSYIHTLKGTNPAGAKEPQGELYTEKAETE
ncbi:c-type cytochrome [Reichenbachiella carrageenanivorans]|uniref:C-type cytochrome n=1 Tax=Reichenbachiella carrageenanivorans TaxID=2979869 RepID=A0ABY6CX59_9BACT|nr:cbb3-type cytochrome c oxidase N-terminal domain-containing protein [Reichenbachiella carrageenanivorans]UXX78490.1 c-type cytochrome [Reichenbachiella carrageenanivorans]